MKNKSKQSLGQSLVELIIAMGIIVLVISSVAFLVIDSYVSGRLSKETTQANFLAEEGMEAIRSIRDNSWDDISPGTYGLALSGSNWILQGSQEDVSFQLNEGIRIITIEEIDLDRKKITSQVDWKFIETRPQQVQLITYLTNWQKIADYCQGICTPCSDILDRKICVVQEGCSWNARYKLCSGPCISCENFLDQASCDSQLGCAWTGP